MSETKFTKAPWSIAWIYAALRHVHKNCSLDTFYIKDAELSAALDRGEISLPRKEDANLIAAAPDLYEALETLVDRAGVITDGIAYEADPHQYSSVLVDALLCLKRAVEEATQDLAKARGEA